MRLLGMTPEGEKSFLFQETPNDSPAVVERTRIEEGQLNFGFYFEVEINIHTLLILFLSVLDFLKTRQLQ